MLAGCLPDLVETDRLVAILQPTRQSVGLEILVFDGVAVETVARPSVGVKLQTTSRLGTVEVVGSVYLGLLAIDSRPVGLAVHLYGRPIKLQ